MSMEKKAPKPKTLGELNMEVDLFNARYPIGTPVLLKRDNGQTMETKTRSKAQVSGGHSAVIWLENVSGYYLLDRVTPLAELEAQNG